MKTFEYISKFNDSLKDFYEVGSSERMSVFKQHFEKSEDKNKIIYKKAFLQECKVTIDKIIFASWNNDLSFNLIYLSKNRIASISFLCRIFLMVNQTDNSKGSNFFYIVQLIKLLAEKKITEKEFYEYLITIKSFLKGETL